MGTFLFGRTIHSKKYSTLSTIRRIFKTETRCRFVWHVQVGCLTKDHEINYNQTVTYEDMSLRGSNG